MKPTTRPNHTPFLPRISPPGSLAPPLFGKPWAILFLAFVVSGAQLLPDNKTMVNHLDIIAFGNEYTGEHFPRVRKWKNPVRIGIQGQAPQFLDADIRQHIGELTRLTGHPLDLLYSETMRQSGKVASDFNTNQLNVIVFYIPHDKIHQTVLKYFDGKKELVDQIIQSSTCFSKFFKKKDEIRAAIIVIPNTLSREFLRACVVEEFAQIMGLPNDSDQISSSIFNDKSPINELTLHDRTLLRLLYDPRITIGMPREKALETAQTILEEMTPEP